MLRRVLTIAIFTALLGGGLTALANPAGAADEPWRLWSRCSQDGVLKMRVAHDTNAAGVERLTSTFKAYTATGQQTWDWKTKVNNVLFGKGTTTTDDTGDLTVAVNREEPGAPVITSLSFDGTNRVTGERCQLTVAVPPIGQPNAVDLAPWTAQGFCTQGTPWKLRYVNHVRPNGTVKFSMSLRIIDGAANQRWTGHAKADDEAIYAVSSDTGPNGVLTTANVGFIGRPGYPITFQTYGVWAEKRDTGEICKVDFNVLPPE